MRDVFQGSLQIVEHDAAAIAPRRHVIVDMDRLPRVDLPDDMLCAIMSMPDGQYSMAARWKGIEMLDASSITKPIDVSDLHRLLGNLIRVLEELRRLELKLLWQPVSKSLIVKPFSVNEHLVLQATVHVVHEPQEKCLHALKKHLNGFIVLAVGDEPVLMLNFLPRVAEPKKHEVGQVFADVTQRHNVR